MRTRRRSKPLADDDEDISDDGLDSEEARRSDIVHDAINATRQKVDRRLLTFFRRWFQARGEDLAA